MNKLRGRRLERTKITHSDVVIELFTFPLIMLLTVVKFVK